MNFDVNLIRFGFLLALAGASYFLQQPITNSAILSFIVGLILASGIIFFETRIRRASIKTLIGGAIGSILGIIGASLIGFFNFCTRRDFTSG